MTAPLTPAERGALLGIARAAIRSRLGLGPPPSVPETGGLGERRGAFVTLHRGGELRGCIGRFEPEGSLARTVADMAVAAAFDDPRFPPLTADEVDDLEIHVSALGPRVPLPDPAQVRVGVHGLVVKQGWDGPTFLKHVCLKAGLRADAWRDPSTTLETFEAEEFGDPARETP